MPYPTTTIKNKLLPFIVKNEHEVVNLYSWAPPGTGDAGSLVTMQSFDPNNTDGYNLDAPMGTQPAGTLSPQYEVKNRIRLAASGDTKWNTLGITLDDSRTLDENDLPLKYFPDKAARLQCVVSGQAVNVMTRGIVTLQAAAYVGIPQPGYVGVIHSGGGGRIEAINPTTLSETAAGHGNYSERHVVGKFLSSTGSSFGGYALFKVEL